MESSKISLALEIIRLGGENVPQELYFAAVDLLRRELV